MKKAIMFATAAILGTMTLAGTTLETQAAQKVVVIGNQRICNITGEQSLKDILANMNWEDCKVLTFPCLPTEDNQTPEIPEVETPEIPELETPEIPELEAPEHNGTQKPEVEQPGEESTQSVHPYIVRIVELVNEERAKAGLNPVTLQEQVTTAAQVRAVEIETSFSHTRPNGTNFSTALKEAGVTYRGFGENIAWGQKTPEQVMTGWMNSAGHRANILNGNYTSIGVGYHQNASGVNYWSQLFTY